MLTNLKMFSPEASHARSHTIHEGIKGGLDAVKDGKISPNAIIGGAVKGAIKGSFEAEVGGARRETPPLAFDVLNK
ncbi:hypothetical protein [Agarilytica rhodophyticola]|uniref:hypothetical protein n=1 Tax=Agarilytica rhodophyticola TaxID=1737490 RepID=UPI000B34908A|nr:hypothetical protein [Agarilytica rhodophyticola]